MPARGKSRVTLPQRHIIALGKLTGKRNIDIARETGLALTTVDHQSRDPRTVTLILAIKEKYRPQLARMFEAALRGIERGLRSKNPHVAHRAGDQFLKYLTAGDPLSYRPVDQATAEGVVTFEELMAIRRRIDQKGETRRAA